MSLKKFFKTIKKHAKEHTETLFKPKKMAEHLKHPLKDHMRQFREFTSTTVGKVVFAAVSFYVGGVLMKAFSGAGGGAAVDAAGSAGSSSVGQITGQATGQTAGQAMLGTTSANFVSGATNASNFVSGATNATNFVSGASGAAGASGGFWSTVGKAAKGAGAWARNNPELVATIASGISSMATPDEMDYMREQEAMKLRDLERQNKNLAAVEDVNIGMQRDEFGNLVRSDRGGLIRRRVTMPKNPYAPAQTQEEGRY